MLPQLPYTAPQSVTDAVVSLGRTEDVRFSPSNRRLAVASFHRNRILLLDIDVADCSGTTHVALTGGVELSSPALQWPHGVDFIDDDTLIVTSRKCDHITHNVLLYENSPALSASAEPAGILRRIAYPHGLRFSADGRHLFVADAGAPYLLIYARDSDQGRGVRHPVAAVRIMDDAMFERGRHNREEGGPKGLDIDAGSRVLVVTSECQPLAFFDVPALLQLALTGGSACEERALDIGHELRLMHEIRRMAEKATEAHAMRNSMSWRITGPLRRLNSYFRRR